MASAGLRQTLPEALKQPARSLRDGYRLATAPLRVLPSVISLGTQRGGSTSLFNYLAQHPDVLPPFGKEIHYFDLRYRSGERWYRSRFPYRHQLRPGMLTMDVTPYYMVHPLVPERMAKLLPDIKLIAFLRNPVERALSHYQHEVRGKREPLTSFAEAIDREPERLAGEEARLRQEPYYYSWNHHRYSYLLRGRYVEHLRRWFQYFPRSQFLLLPSERLYRDPAGTMALVHRFLGLRSQQLAQYESIYEKGNYDRGMPAPLRQRLAAYFEPYNRELYELLGEEYDWA